MMRFQDEEIEYVYLKEMDQSGVDDKTIDYQVTSTELVNIQDPSYKLSNPSN